MIVTNWKKYHPYFREDEFRCKQTGGCWMQSEFMDLLFEIRLEYARPMAINSGCRDKTHPLERSKIATGEHQLGTCADIRVYGAHALALLRIALARGVPRIGVAQKGPVESRFLHLGIGGGQLPSPALWSY